VSRFFKSAAFPIIIVVVLAFFAQRLILSNGTETQPKTWNDLVTKADEGKITYIKTNIESNSVKYSTDPEKKQITEIGIPSEAELNKVLDTIDSPTITGSTTATIEGSKTGGSPWWSVLTYILPGNPALVKAGPLATPQHIAEMERRMGLDQPMAVQYWRYVRGLAHGDLGESHTTGRPVLEDLLQRVPATLELTLAALAVGGVVAVGGVDLELHQGEITALMGRNGAGKSSLMWALQGSGPRQGGRVVDAGGRDPAGAGDRAGQRGGVRPAGPARPDDRPWRVAARRWPSSTTTPATR